MRLRADATSSTASSRAPRQGRQGRAAEGHRGLAGSAAQTEIWGFRPANSAHPLGSTPTQVQSDAVDVISVPPEASSAGIPADFSRRPAVAPQTAHQEGKVGSPSSSPPSSTSSSSPSSSPLWSPSPCSRVSGRFPSPGLLLSPRQSLAPSSHFAEEKTEAWGGDTGYQLAAVTSGRRMQAGRLQGRP